MFEFLHMDKERKKENKSINNIIRIIRNDVAGESKLQ